jgi:hypothetical protein
MIERDYLMRILKQFFDVLNKLINNIDPEKEGDIQVQLKGLFLDYLGNDYAFFCKEPIEKIMETISTGTQTDALAKATMLSELFYNSAILSEEEDLKNMLFIKSLFLLKFIDSNSNTFSFERQRRIAELNELVKA